MSSKHARWTWMGISWAALLWVAAPAAGLSSAGCLARPLVFHHPERGWVAEFREGLRTDFARFSPRGKLLFVQSGPEGHFDGYGLRVFEAHRLRFLWQRETYHGRFDSSGTYVAGIRPGSHSSTLEVWRARTGHRVVRLPHAGGFALSGAGHLALARVDRIDILDLQSRKTLRSIPVRGTVHDLMLSADGRRLAYAAIARSMSPWRVCPMKQKPQVRWSQSITRPATPQRSMCHDEYNQRLLRVVDLRSGRILCSTTFNPDEQPYRRGGFGSPDLKHLEVGVQDSRLLLDVERCWPVARMKQRGRFVAKKGMWAAVHGRTVRVFDLSTASWRATIRWRRPERSRAYISPDLRRAAALKTYKGVQTLIVMPLERPRWVPAPKQRLPFRWLSVSPVERVRDEKRDQAANPSRSPMGSALQQKDATVGLRAQLTHTGVLLQITNRSSREIHVDWRRTYLVSPAGRRLDTTSTYRSYTRRCYTGPMDRNPQLLRPGVRHVEELVTLRRRSYKGLWRDVGDPTPGCGQKTRLQVGLVIDGKHCQQRTITFVGVCPSPSAKRPSPPTQPSRRKVPPVFRFHPMLPRR